MHVLGEQEMYMCPNCEYPIDACECACPYCSESSDCSCAVGHGKATGG